MDVIVGFDVRKGGGQLFDQIDPVIFRTGDGSPCTHQRKKTSQERKPSKYSFHAVLMKTGRRFRRT
jgi:hypothetical protein